MSRRTGLLHLQLGQETIYLLLAASLASALILAIIAAQQATRIAQLESVERRDQPPIITLTEASGYSFPSGRADISEGFRRQLREDVIPDLADYRRQYGVTVIEVIGHTDEQPLGASVSTLDAQLLPLLAGETFNPLTTSPPTQSSDPLTTSPPTQTLDPLTTTAPTPSDNVGLGMLRAAAIVTELRNDPRTAGMIILPLSAGQTTETSDLLAEPGGERADRARRRIEIRMRQSNNRRREAP